MTLRPIWKRLLGWTLRPLKLLVFDEELRRIEAVQKKVDALYSEAGRMNMRAHEILVDAKRLNKEALEMNVDAIGRADRVVIDFQEMHCELEDLRDDHARMQEEN